MKRSTWNFKFGARRHRKPITPLQSIAEHDTTNFASTNAPWSLFVRRPLLHVYCGSRCCYPKPSAFCPFWRKRIS